MTSAHCAAAAGSSTISPSASAFFRDLLAACKPDADVHAAVLQIQRVRMPLRSVTDNRHLAVADQRQVRVGVVVNLRHWGTSRLCRVGSLECLRSRVSGLGLHRIGNPGLVFGHRRRAGARRAAALAARHRDAAGAHHLEHAVWAQDVEQAVDLRPRIPRSRSRATSGATSTTRAPNTSTSCMMGAPAGRVGADLDERQIADHGGPLRDVVDADDVDQLVQVRFDPVRAAGVGLHDDGHARHAGRFGVTDRRATRC